MKRSISISSFALTLLIAVVLTAAANTQAAGRKYGVFIGINKYQGGINNLNGAVNDAKNLRNLMITSFGFAATDTVLLTDAMATRAGIINALNTASMKVGPGDFFVFSYSGHGTLFPDEDSFILDEKKPVSVNLPAIDYEMPLALYDSAICPVDAASSSSGLPWNNLILDDEIYEMVGKFVAKGAKVVFISDSCHSGTIGKGEMKGKNIARLTTPNTIFGGKKFADIKFTKPGMQITADSRVFSGSYLVLSASQDSEVSWDVSLGGVPQGLFTANLLSIIKSAGKNAKALDYSSLMNSIRDKVVEYSENECDTIQTPRITTDFGKSSDKIFQP